VVARRWTRSGAAFFARRARFFNSPSRVRGRLHAIVTIVAAATAGGGRAVASRAIAAVGGFVAETPFPWILADLASRA